ncbi:MAG: amidohydrolase [Oligosphaeraceae bacterium]|nr:amidohydrolase [Oligosphaeraceae bacterium]
MKPPSAAWCGLVMRIFDVHTHVFPEKIAARALRHLQEVSHELPVFSDGTRPGQLANAAKAGISGMLNCPVVTNAGQMRSVNDWVASWHAWPYLSLGGICPEAEDLLPELQRIRQLGLPGIKLHPEYQSFNPLEERMQPVWQTCQDLNLIVFFHAGNDIGFPEPGHSKPADFAELAQKYPRLRVVCAHMGGWRKWDEVERDLVGTNVYLDTSFALSYMPEQEQFRRIIEKHGTERILFGSDSPWQNLWTAVNEILLLQLPKEEQDKILWQNAADLFELEEKCEC